MLATFVRLISASGEYRSPSRVRPYASQSLASTVATLVVTAGPALLIVRHERHAVTTAARTNTRTQRSAGRLDIRCSDDGETLFDPLSATVATQDSGKRTCSTSFHTDDGDITHKRCRPIDLVKYRRCDIWNAGNPGSVAIDDRL